VSKTRLLSCDGCTLCCRGDTIFIHPELGDKAEDYQTEKVANTERLMLAHKPNGDCIYMLDQGCTNYENRPAICREFSCVALLKGAGYTKLRKLVKRGHIKKGMLETALKLSRRAV